MDGEDVKITTSRTSLKVPFTVMEKYMEYVTDKTRFATHQGVKGLEFPHVVVIMDDNEARDFLFSYEKLFGAYVWRSLRRFLIGRFFQRKIKNCLKSNIEFRFCLI